MAISISTLSTALILVIAALLMGFYFGAILVDTLSLRQHAESVREQLDWFGIVFLIVIFAVGAGMLFVYTGGMKWIRPLFQ